MVLYGTAARNHVFTLNMNILQYKFWFLHILLEFSKSMYNYSGTDIDIAVK